MGPSLTGSSPPLHSIEWASSAYTQAGETASGDRLIVQPYPGGALVGLVDGLGHGEEAGAAAQAAISLLEKSPQESILSLVRLCHEALRGTRGAAMTLVSINEADRTLMWLGVGNVHAVLQRQDSTAVPPSETILLRGGVVGYQLPELRAAMVIVSPGDLLLMATDGIRVGFEEGVPIGDKLQTITDRIMSKHCLKTDDATVVAVRYVGR